jgi:hypothetical protein
LLSFLQFLVSPLFLALLATLLLLASLLWLISQLLLPQSTPAVTGVILLHGNPFQQSIFISCKEHLPYMQTSYKNFQCKSELLLHPIESFLIFLTKFVLLGQKYIWPEPDCQDLYWTNGKRPFTQGLRGMTVVPLAAKFGSSTW